MAKKQQGNFMKTALAAAAASSAPETVEATGETEAAKTAVNAVALAVPKPKQPRGRPPATAPKTAPPKTKLIGGHFDPAVGRQLKMLAAEQGRTIQDVLGEALNDLFVKHKKKPIA
jgi:hypothetical protein